jgi:hypothetical protein
MREENNMDSRITIKWLDKPVEPDFTAAESYLSLIYDPQTATTICKQLKQAPMSKFKAKDTLVMLAYPQFNRYQTILSAAVEQIIHKQFGCICKLVY